MTEDEFNKTVQVYPPSTGVSSAGTSPGSSAGSAAGGSPASGVASNTGAARPLLRRPFAHALGDHRGYKELVRDYASDVRLRERMAYWRRSSQLKLALDEMAKGLSVAIRVKCQELSAIVDMQEQMLPPATTGKSLDGGGGIGGGDGSVSGEAGAEESRPESLSRSLYAVNGNLPPGQGN